MPLPMEKRYTLADALTWDEQERIELIYGDLVMVSQPPVRIHQKASTELLAQLHAYLKGKNARSTMLLLPFAHLSMMEMIRRTWTRWWSQTSP